MQWLLLLLLLFLLKKIRPQKHRSENSFQCSPIPSTQHIYIRSNYTRFTIYLNCTQTTPHFAACRKTMQTTKLDCITSIYDQQFSNERTPINDDETCYPTISLLFNTQHHIIYHLFRFGQFHQFKSYVYKKPQNFIVKSSHFAIDNIFQFYFFYFL